MRTTIAMLTAFPLLAGTVLAGTVTAHAATGPTVTTRVSHFSGGGVTVPGNRWLQRSGVNVYRARQCTELATRLYTKRHWGTISNIYGMRAGRTYSKTLTFHRNGSGYTPVPGDVLVELGGSYQHVAVVDRVTTRAVHTKEQNATASGIHIYPRRGAVTTGAYGPRHVGGFIHSTRNHHANPTTTR